MLFIGGAGGDGFTWLSTVFDAGGAGAEMTIIAGGSFAGAFSMNLGDGADTLAIETAGGGTECLFRGP
ncbi:MAG: hypothetical protein ACRC1H_17270 [Caldilineaceae bacterium]